MAGLLGRKVGMTRVFADDGQAVPVTVVQVGPCLVAQIKTLDRDGYEAVQLAFEDKAEKNVNRPATGHFTKAGMTPKRLLREFEWINGIDDVNLGDSVGVDLFEVGEAVTVTGWSKGKGFQGVVKRHGFRGGPKSHGQSDRLRAPGSIGQASSPARVFKGVKMAGRTGGKKVTLRNRYIVRIIAEKNILFIRGTIPGSNSGLILIKK